MDQITQGAPTPVPPSPSPQPGPQQNPPTVAPQTPIAPLPSAPPPATTFGPGTSGAPSKLKNPKLWIGAGVLLLIVVVGAAIFLGKPPLFPGKSQLPGVPTLPPVKPAAEEKGAVDICAGIREETICSKAAKRGICIWADGKCQTPGGAVAPVEPEIKVPGGGVPGIIGPVVPGEGKEPPAEPPPPPPEDLETTRRVALENAGPLVVAADAAATEAKRQVDKEYIEEANIEAAKSAANDAQAAAAAARDAAKTIKDAQTLEEIQAAFANVQTSHDTALEKRDVVTALVRAAEDAAQYARERTQAAEAAQAAQARAFEQRCDQEKGTPNPDGTCTLTDDTKVSNIAELEEAVRRIQEESARRAFQEDCESEKLQWQDKDNQCIFNGTAYNNSQALEAALAAVADEDQKKKDCEDKNKDPKAPEWRWDGKECVGGKVAVADVPKCPAEKPVFFGKECHEQNELCSTLGAKLTDELKAKNNIDPKDIEHAVAEINSLSKCGFTADQFRAPFEEEKAKNECAAKDQSVWEWDASEKQCKNKQEGRMRELESLVASLQGQLANAQNSNNNAQINALAQQIATLNSQINELRGSADEPVPIVVNVIAPPAPSPAPASAAPPAAPASAPAAPPSGGGGGGEVVAVAVPEVKKEEKKDSKKKKGAKTETDATSAETAAASAPAVSDSGAAATAPAKTAAAATGGTGAKAASGAAGAASAAHGAFIQGRTGPGVLIYPLAVIGANGVWYVLRKKRKR